MLTHWRLLYLSCWKGNVCWAELSPTSITHISCLGDMISQYTSKQHITWLTNTGTKIRKAGTPPPSTPMRVHTLLDRVGRLQVTVIHCLVYTSQGSLWHKDRLKLYTLHTEKDMAVSTAILGKTWMYWAEFLNNSEVISSLRTLTRTTPCQALW